MNKTILITGSTDGIGKLAAIKLAQEGHHLYLHGRNPEKLTAVISEVKEISGNDNVSGYVADFSDLNAVREMAASITNETSKLDVLINNAGVFKSQINETPQGLDLRFTVNYLAPYLLTQKLMPLLENATGARIINVSSAAQAPVLTEALLGKVRLSTQMSYAQSKLALIMWSFYLAKNLPDSAVIAINPGSLLNTKMAIEGFGKYWSPAAKGGNMLYELAVSEAYENVTGKYFDNDKGEEKGSFGDAHQDAYNEKLIEKLIEATDSIVNGM